MRVALATCLKLPEPDPDQGPLLEALRRRGLQAEMLAWDDPAADPGAFDFCVIRSTWNYPRRAEAFAAWLERAAQRTRLFNPLSVVQWNLHKSYLAQLADRGVPIIPTVWLKRGARVSLDSVKGTRKWGEVVIKPAISAGSFHTRRFGSADQSAAQAFLDEQIQARDIMVQRYMPSVGSVGERSLIWIDGAFTHAVRKVPRYAGGREHVSEAEELTDEDREFGARVMGGVEGDLLYARVDIIRDDDGRPCLSELELIEPSLFLVQHPPALERFADAIGSRAREL